MCIYQHPYYTTVSTICSNEAYHKIDCGKFCAAKARAETEKGKGIVFEKELENHLLNINARCKKGKGYYYRYYFKTDPLPITIHKELESRGFLVQQVPNKKDGLDGKTFKIIW